MKNYSNIENEDDTKTDKVITKEVYDEFKTNNINRDQLIEMLRMEDPYLKNKKEQQPW